MAIDRAPPAVPPGAQLVTRRFETAAGAPLEQRVIVRPTTVRDRPWLLVYAEVGPADAFDSEGALAHAATLAVGGLCLLDDVYYLQHGVPRTASVADVDVVIELIAHEAARLRAELVTAPPAIEEAFAGYAD